MARPIHILTADAILRLPPGRHADGNGLYVQCLPGGGRSWLFRYDLAGKCRWMGLGAVAADRIADDLAGARRKAVEAREQLQRGCDPLAEKRARKAPPAADRSKTFADCAAAYVAAHRDGWRSIVHARQWQQTLDDYVLPLIGRLPIADVGPADVKRVLAPLWRTKPEVARKLCGKVGMIIRYGIASGYREKDNPASLLVMRTVLGPLRQKPKHHPSIPYKDIPGLLSKLDGRTDIPALALQWLILTATRSSEARCPTWAEIDKGKALWTIPGARMKGGEEHTVPLSLRALGILDKVSRTSSPFVFVAQGRDPVTETSLRNLLRELGVGKDAGSLHGMRASFRNWAAETGVADDVAEACLAHQVPDAVIRAYKRTRFIEARRSVMESWGLFLS